MMPTDRRHWAAEREDRYAWALGFAPDSPGVALKVRAVVAVADEEQAELRAEIEHLRRDLREVQRGWLDRPLASNWHYSQASGHILDRADLRKDGGNVIPGPFGGLGG